MGVQANQCDWGTPAQPHSLSFTNFPSGILFLSKPFVLPRNLRFQRKPSFAVLNQGGRGRWSKEWGWWRGGDGGCSYTCTCTHAHTDTHEHTDRQTLHHRRLLIPQRKDMLNLRWEFTRLSLFQGQIFLHSEMLLLNKFAVRHGDGSKFSHLLIVEPCTSVA